MKRIMVLMLAAMGIVACGGGGKAETAGGRPYEIIVPIAQSLWDCTVGDSLRSVLTEEVDMLPQAEPMFDIVRINPNAISSLLLRHRNILQIAVSDTVSAPTSVAYYNRYAQPQIIVSLVAPDAASLAQYIASSKTELQQLFEITERNRGIINARRYNEKTLENDIFSQFGIHLNIPKGYRRAKTADSDWIWILNDNKTASQGVLIYSYPYGGINDFTENAMIARRNEFVRRIETERAGAYMTTNTEAPIEMRYIRINGRAWAEMRSFWDVVGDAMGGPAITYATVSADGKSVLTIDCYLFSPQMPKRNMYRALEHLVYSAVIPEISEE